MRSQEAGTTWATNRFDLIQNAEPAPTYLPFMSGSANAALKTFVLFLKAFWNAARLGVVAIWRFSISWRAALIWPSTSGHRRGGAAG
eukprot:82999-Pyramimonas_sp.AAC.2